MEKIVKYFLENYNFQLLDLQNAINSKDMHQIKMFSHKIKSSVGNIGAKKAVEYAAIIEESDESISIDEIVNTFLLLEEQLNEIKDVFINTNWKKNLLN